MAGARRAAEQHHPPGDDAPAAGCARRRVAGRRSPRRLHPRERRRAHPLRTRRSREHARRALVLSPPAPPSLPALHRDALRRARGRALRAEEHRELRRAPHDAQPHRRARAAGDVLPHLAVVVVRLVDPAAVRGLPVPLPRAAQARTRALFRGGARRHHRCARHRARPPARTLRVAHGAFLRLAPRRVRGGDGARANDRVEARACERTGAALHARDRRRVNALLRGRTARVVHPPRRTRLQSPRHRRDDGHLLGGVAGSAPPRAASRLLRPVARPPLVRGLPPPSVAAAVDRRVVRQRARRAPRRGARRARTLGASGGGARRMRPIAQ